MPVNVEVKVSAKTGREELCAELAESLLAVLREADAMRLALISSFDIDLLSIISRISPELPLAYLFNSAPEDLERWAKSGILTAFHPEGHLLSAETIAMAKRYGIKTNVWTINETADMARLVTAGVDGLITNYPERWDANLLA